VPQKVAAALCFEVGWEPVAVRLADGGSSIRLQQQVHDLEKMLQCGEPGESDQKDPIRSLAGWRMRSAK
jgi:hypothetical protein